MINKGKAFEQKLKEDFIKVPDSHIERVYDVTSGYKSIKTRSDFIGYIYPNLFFLEAKSHNGNTFPFSALTQYAALLEVAGKKGIRAGVVIWFIDHKKVLYVPVRTIETMKKEGKKSVNINHLDDYRIFEIPSKVRRVFLDSDYSILKTLEEGD